MNRPYLKSVNPYGNDLLITANRSWGYHITVFNSSGSSFYAQLFDSANNTPSGQPDFEVQVPAGGYVAFPFHKDGWPFGKGIYVRPVGTAGGSNTITNNSAKVTALYDVDALS